MSIHSRGARTRARVLALLSSGILAAGVVATVPAASAATADRASSTQAPATPLGAGRYVVMLRQPGATRYEGGTAGLAATAAGKAFNGRSAKVRAYSAYLERSQDRLAASVGATPTAQTTIASNAFTARLTATQAAALAGDRAVLSIFKDEVFSVDTWNTPTFLGLEGAGGVWGQRGGVEDAGKGVVVGVLDSGIWPESASFAGTALNRNPNRAGAYRLGNDIYVPKADGSVFHGFCEPGAQWSSDLCTSKLVGARYYPEAFLDSVPPQHRDVNEHKSTRDGDGHGSHTAGTATGNHAVPATVEGRSFGNVSGIAPAAHIAAYKICFNDDNATTGGCYTSASLQAIDDAVTDGVDVINYSISGATTTVVDAVEYAYLGAAAAGVFVAASAGNSGPTASTVAHNSPWLTTVAASTHTNFENTVVLGNGSKHKGASINGAAVPSTPLVNSSASGLPGADATALSLCGPGTLDPAKVTGTMVVCVRGVYDRVAKSAEVARAGGVAMILANPGGQSLDADFHAVPTVHVANAAGAAITSYAATAGATAAFEVGDTTGGATTPVPQIAGFSSRGPAIANDSDVIKPDISAPGVSVLAAVAPPSGQGRDFDLYSGTSMSSPHIAGLAAFILGENPGWSPMTVKSAMMTTAYDLSKADGTKDQNPFNQGAGHVDPTKFFRPGLAVTSDEDDWLSFIDGQGLDFPGIEPMAASDLNMPSIAQGQVAASTTIARTFTGLETGTWNVAVDLPGFATTPDKPAVVIDEVGDQVTVSFDFTRTDAPLAQFATGFVTLTGPTTVRMPIALRPVAVRAPGEVAGTGASGRTTVDITSGQTGELDLMSAGLAKAFTHAGSLPVGEAYERPTTIAAGTKAARFDVDATNDAADLDLYVYRLNAAGTPVALAGQSATGSADERVTVRNPKAGNYLVVVDGYSAAPGESGIDYRYDEFLVDATATAGSFRAEPDPLPVVQGEDTSYDVVWDGLASGRYLGLVEYAGALAPTYVSVIVE